MNDIEMLRETGFCKGIENYSAVMSGRKPGQPPFTLLDYFPEDFLLFCDESHVMLPQVRGMYGGDRSRKASLIDYGFRLPSAFDNRPLQFDEFYGKINQVIFTSATPGDLSGNGSAQIVEQVIRPTGLLDPNITVKPTEDQMDDLVSEINLRTQRGERVLVTTLTKPWPRILPSIWRDSPSRCGICTMMWIPWSVWRSFAICAWANSTCWWGLTCCVRDWIFRR